MKATYKTCIYLKGREKPIIVTDKPSEDNSHSDTVDFFHEALSGENKVVTINSFNDHIILNLKDIEAVIVSKPALDDVDDISVLDESDDDVDINDESITEEVVPSKETTDDAVPEDEEVFNNDSDDIEVVED